MKTIYIILLLLSIQVFGQNQSVIETTLRSAAEEIITRGGFTLLSAEIQDKAMREQAMQQDSDSCLDDRCVIDTGKMLSVERLFMIHIADLGRSNFMFKISDINLESGETLATRSEIYIGDINNSKELFQFSKKLFSSIMGKVKRRGKRHQTKPAMIQVVFDAEKMVKKVDVPEYDLTISSKYDPVSVFDGKKFLGTTPLKVKVQGGIYLLTFEKEGYGLTEKRIKISRDLEIREIPFQENVTLTVKAGIDNAMIALNGVRKGRLSGKKLDLKLSPGRYTISLNKQGYYPVTRRVKLEQSMVLDFGEIYFAGGPYPINIKSREGSILYINGEEQDGENLRLKIGKYQLKLYNHRMGEINKEIIITKPEGFTIPLNSGFRWVDARINTTFLYTDFPFQRNSSHFMGGIDLSFFRWAWSWCSLDIIGGGFYAGINSDKMVKLHLAGFHLYPIDDLSINIAIGPIGGDLINLYDNIQDSYITYGGLTLNYRRLLWDRLYLNVEAAAHYGTKNSENNFYSDSDNSMDRGWLYSGSIGVGYTY